MVWRKASARLVDLGDEGAEGQPAGLHVGHEGFERRFVITVFTDIGQHGILSGFSVV